jgi:catechol 2,3-dioxygenase-like lactoylglutathione lyase family enzyme
MSDNTMFSDSQITVMVPDMDEAVRFYTEKLHLRLKARYGNEFAMVEAPGLTIGLHPRPKDASAASHPASIGLGVVSLESTLAELKARGVDFPSAIVEDPPIRIVHFTDPGGMPMYLVEQSGWR